MQKYPNSQISWVWKMVCARLFFLCLHMHARTGNEATSNHIWSGPCSDTMLFLPRPTVSWSLIVHSKLCCCQPGTTFTYLCECELIRPTNKVCLCGVKSNYYYYCELNILVDSIQMAMLIVERVHKWALVVMWQSRIEIEHYCTLVSISSLVAVTDRNRTLFRLSHKKWVNSSNQGLGAYPTCVQVSVLFITSTSSDAHESGFTLGHYIGYASGTINTW